MGSPAGSSVSTLFAFFRKRSTQYALLVANISIPVLFLFAGFLHTRASGVFNPPTPLFDLPDKSWVDLLSDKDAHVYTDTLAPVLYANFTSDIIPESLILTDGSGRNLREEVSFWGGKADVSAKQFLFVPEFDFYPGPLTFDLSYQTVDGEEHHCRKRVDLNFVAHFSLPLDRRFWAMQQGLTAERWKDAVVLSLEPGEKEKSALVFSKPYHTNAQVELQFIPESETPNLSVSFNERTSFIIGDGTNNQIKFKHGLALPNTPNRYFQRTWPIPSLISGEPYRVKITRAGKNYGLVLSDSHGTVYSSISFNDANTNASEEQFPLISVWVFRNTHNSIIARTYLSGMTIFFP